jgi:site-specific recombinase XerD
MIPLRANYKWLKGFSSLMRLESLNQHDPVGTWLTLVSYSHSQSKSTEEQYKRVWGRFSHSTGMTAKQILADYENLGETIARKKHAQIIRAWIGQLDKERLTNTSIKVMVGAIKSFYKYNDLPLGLVPQAMGGIVYHNRDITKEEIVQIMSISKIREKAFFAVMAQSGLRPHTMKQLKLKNLESFDSLPCKIEVPQEITKGKFGSHVTFIGSDAIKYLKQYLATRTDLTPNSLLFCSHTDSTKMVNVKDVSRAFRMAARKLEESGALNFEIREGKPSELRLYILRKFFRKYANQMGFEHVNFMMGHTTRGSDSSYTPKDPEWYRDLYTEKAMPFLRLESATPTETEKTIAELKKQLEGRDKELEEMKRMMVELQPLVDFMNRHPTEEEMKRELGLDDEDDLEAELGPKKSEEEALAAVRDSVRADDELEEMFRKKGLPMTKEDYEERKRKLGKTSR